MKYQIYINYREWQIIAEIFEFEKEYGEICNKANVERILADELWLVGHIFCKELPLCNRCWIGEWCQNKDGNYT